jgi:hypothetical protein
MSLDNKILLEGQTNIGGPFKTDLENGPSDHAKRPLGNWQSDNAWDIFAPAGSVVNSYTDGTVKKVRDTGTNAGKIYGTQVTVTGGDGYPDIFYTHLRNVKLKSGDVVKVGDRIGEVSDWVGHDKMTHVHIGLPTGKHLKDLLKNSSAIFSGKGSESTSGSTTSTTTEDPTSLLGFLKSAANLLKVTGVGKEMGLNEETDRIKDIMRKIL